MPEVIISDTSCLIILSKIGNLEILKSVYGKIITTPEIATEFGENLPDWFEIRQVKDFRKQQLLEFQIDRGESSAIALALETEGSKVILDDNKARKVARQMGISFTGTLGIIVKAKNMGLIPTIKPFLEEIKQTNFRISKELEVLALGEADEK